MVVDTSIGERHHAAVDVVDELLDDGAGRIGDGGDDALGIVQGEEGFIAGTEAAVAIHVTLTLDEHAGHHTSTVRPVLHIIFNELLIRRDRRRPR